jgi:hypothetical protein
VHHQRRRRRAPRKVDLGMEGARKVDLGMEECELHAVGEVEAAITE